MREKVFNLALIEAIKAYKKDEVPIGAVIFDPIKNQIISKAHNLVEKTKDPSAHAEILAIRKATKKLKDWRLNSLELYTTLEPCPMCADTIQKSRIKSVFFLAFDPKGGICKLGLEELLLNNNVRNHKVTLIKINNDALEKQSSDLLKSFFKNKRKKLDK